MYDAKQKLLSNTDKDECIICYADFDADQPYSRINKSGEFNFKYHTECLESWFHKNRIGTITKEPIKGYTIYQNDNVIEEIRFDVNLNNDNNNNNKIDGDTNKLCKMAGYICYFLLLLVLIVFFILMAIYS